MKKTVLFGSQVLLYVLAITIFPQLFLSCNQKRQTPTEHTIYLEKDSGLVYCYADSQRVVFNNDYMDGGAMAMMLYHIDSCVYVIGDLVPNSDGWTVRYKLYRVDSQTLETKHIGDFAAIYFEDDGFKAATARLTNPDATCTADEVFVMQDNFYSYDGTLIRKGEDEYNYDDMIAQYSDSLVNADGIRLGNNVIQ